MSTAILYRMPYGIAGDVTRQSQSKIEAQLFGATPFPAYGRFGRHLNGEIIPIGAGDTAEFIWGLLIRPFPTQSSDALGDAVPPTTGLGDFMRSGYAAVRVYAGSPTLGTPVHIRVANGTPSQPIGGIEAVATADTITVPNCFFQCPKDAGDIAEISYNI